MGDYVGDLRKIIGTRPIIMCGANVIIINENDEILMHHRVDNNCWGLPGGAMELGESLEDTARREVFEEVGITCGEIKLFNIYSGKELYYKYPDGNEVYNVTATYTCTAYTGDIVVDTNEGIEARFFSIDNIPNNLSAPIKGIVQDFVTKYVSKKLMF